MTHSVKSTAVRSLPVSRQLITVAIAIAIAQCAAVGGVPSVSFRDSGAVAEAFLSLLLPPCRNIGLVSDATVVRMT